MTASQARRLLLALIPGLILVVLFGVAPASATVVTAGPLPLNTSTTVKITSGH